MSIVQSGGHGQVTSLFVRGGESDNTKVLLDGIPVNDPGGSFNFANLSAADIDHIEVVRGPQSALYGSDAIAGTLQVSPAAERVRIPGPRRGLPSKEVRCLPPAMPAA